MCEDVMRIGKLQTIETMKKIILLSTVAILSAVLFNSCVKNYPDNNFNEGYWLSQESGEVVYSDSYCGYYVVETYYGYTILRSRAGYRPLEGSIVYGNFGNFGVRDFYNRSSRIVFTGEVIEVDLSYMEAQEAIYYYCPYARENTQRIRESASRSMKIQRPAAQ